MYQKYLPVFMSHLIRPPEEKLAPGVRPRVVPTPVPEGSVFVLSRTVWHSWGAQVGFTANSGLHTVIFIRPDPTRGETTPARTRERVSSFVREKAHLTASPWDVKALPLLGNFGAYRKLRQPPYMTAFFFQLSLESPSVTSVRVTGVLQREGTTEPKIREKLAAILGGNVVVADPASEASPTATAQGRSAWRDNIARRTVTLSLPRMIRATLSLPEAIPGIYNPRGDEGQLDGAQVTEEQLITLTSGLKSQGKDDLQRALEAIRAANAPAVRGAAAGESVRTSSEAVSTQKPPEMPDAR